MPLSVRKRAGRYRLVEPNGKISKTHLGNSRDGGGHKSKAKATRQQNKINSAG